MSASEPTPLQHVFLTGGSGFVGSAVIEELLGRGHQVTALLHRGKLRIGADKVKVVQGDLFSPGALDQALAGATAIIHLVGIIREAPREGITFEKLHVQATQNLVQAAERAGVRRFVHMSALGARQAAPSNYHQTKFRAEQAVRASSLQWTILQPSLIHGPHGEFLKMQAAWARGKSPPWLFMPYFGGGPLGLASPRRVQPVYVDDVARALVEALDKPQTIGKTYEMGGAQTFTWPQMHHLASKAFTGHAGMAFPIPAWWAKALTHLAPGLPFTRDQVIMAGEDSVADMTTFLADFGWEPRGFADTLGSYAASV